MTNLEIISAECVTNGIKASVDTYAGWKRKGFQVRKGEKAVFKTKIWKPCKAKKSENTDNDEKQSKMYLVKAAFFTDEQVDAIA